MKAVLPFVLLLALVVHFGAHVFLVARIALAKQPGAPPWRSPLRAVTAFFLSPLAPLWAHQAGMKRTTFVWIGSLVLYALGVALA